MKIEFKGKIQTMYNVDDTVAYTFVAFPVLKRTHVDMDAARSHPKYGAYANSDLFPAILARLRKEILNGRAYLRIDKLPDNVTVDTSGFLASVTVSV